MPWNCCMEMEALRRASGSILVEMEVLIESFWVPDWFEFLAFIEEIGFFDLFLSSAMD